jgi:hypothetical protein
MPGCAKEFSDSERWIPVALQAAGEFGRSFTVILVSQQLLLLVLATRMPGAPLGPRIVGCTLERDYNFPPKDA